MKKIVILLLVIIPNIIGSSTHAYKINREVWYPIVYRNNPYGITINGVVQEYCSPEVGFSVGVLNVLHLKKLYKDSTGVAFLRKYTGRVYYYNYLKSYEKYVACMETKMQYVNDVDLAKIIIHYENGIRFTKLEGVGALQIVRANAILRTKQFTGICDN